MCVARQHPLERDQRAERPALIAAETRLAHEAHIRPGSSVGPTFSTLERRSSKTPRALCCKHSQDYDSVDLETALPMTTCLCTNYVPGVHRRQTIRHASAAAFKIGPVHRATTGTFTQRDAPAHETSAAMMPASYCHREAGACSTQSPGLAFTNDPLVPWQRWSGLSASSLPVDLSSCARVAPAIYSPDRRYHCLCRAMEAIGAGACNPGACA
jgi:hypothetical protein